MKLRFLILLLSFITVAEAQVNRPPFGARRIYTDTLGVAAGTNVLFNNTATPTTASGFSLGSSTVPWLAGFLDTMRASSKAVIGSLTAAGDSALTLYDGTNYLGLHARGGLFTGALSQSGGSVWLDGTTGATPTSGAGTRFMWVPSLQTFVAGTTAGTDWDALPNYSFIAGYQVDAFNDTSFVWGARNSARNKRIIQMGTGNIENGVSGRQTTQIGYGNVSTSDQGSNLQINFGQQGTWLGNTIAGSSGYSAQIGSGNYVGGGSAGFNIQLGWADTVTTGTSASYNTQIGTNLQSSTHFVNQWGSNLKAQYQSVWQYGFSNTAVPLKWGHIIAPMNLYTIHYNDYDAAQYASIGMGVAMDNVNDSSAYYFAAQKTSTGAYTGRQNLNLDYAYSIANGQFAVSKYTRIFVYDGTTGNMNWFVSTSDASGHPLGLMNFGGATALQMGGTTFMDASINLSNIGTYSGGAITATGDDNVISIATSNATLARTLINWKRQSSNMWDWNLLSSATNDLGLYSYGLAGYVITVARSTGAATFASTISSGAITSSGVTTYSVNATLVDGENIRFNRSNDEFRYNSIYSLSNSGGLATISFRVHDGVTATSQVTPLTLYGTGAATFASTVTTGDNIYVPNTAGIFTSGLESGLALRTAGNVEIYNGSAVKLSITTTGAATFASTITNTGASNMAARFAKEQYGVAILYAVPGIMFNLYYDGSGYKFDGASGYGGLNYFEYSTGRYVWHSTTASGATDGAATLTGELMTLSQTGAATFASTISSGAITAGDDVTTDSSFYMDGSTLTQAAPSPDSVYWVSPSFPNKKNRYSTIGAAMVAASAGKTIMVMPGTYANEDTITAKDNVTLYFMPGARMEWRLPPAALIVFTGANLWNFKIQGHGVFYFYDNVNAATNSQLINLTGDSCNVVFEADSLWWTGNTIGGSSSIIRQPSTMKLIKLRMDIKTLVLGNRATLSYAFNSDNDRARYNDLYFRANKVLVDSGNCFVVNWQRIFGGEMYFKADRILIDSLHHGSSTAYCAVNVSGFAGSSYSNISSMVDIGYWENPRGNFGTKNTAGSGFYANQYVTIGAIRGFSSAGFSAISSTTSGDSLSYTMIKVGEVNFGNINLTAVNLTANDSSRTTFVFEKIVNSNDGTASHGIQTLAAATAKLEVRGGTIYVSNSSAFSIKDLGSTGITKVIGTIYSNRAPSIAGVLQVGTFTVDATFALLNTTATTVNAFSAATALNMGAATGTATIAGNLVVTNRSHAFLDISDNDSTEAYTLTTQNVFYTATNWRMSISTNATLADSQVTITKAGKYLVNYSSSFNANASRTFDSYIFVDDVVEKRIGFERTMGTSTAIGSTSATGIITLTANQVVKIKWRQTSTAASSTVTIQHAQLVLTPIFQ